nr:hypothetical transcript [Hymenolepis microstoma]
MEFKIAVIFYIIVFTSFVSSISIIPAKINETVTLIPCPIPQVEGVEHFRRDWYRDDEMITAYTSENLKVHESNGSLSVIATYADVNHLYRCRGLAILSNGTKVLGEFQPYVISPITPAFLEHELQNITVSFGEEYEINCKAGGLKSTLEIKVNGGIAVIFYIIVFTSFVSSISIIPAKINETVTLIPCPIPQVEGVEHFRRDWYRDDEMITAYTSENLKVHESNGSLSVIATYADVNHLYRCRGLAILSNGTKVLGEFQPYVISPITPAFLEHELQNITVSFGEEYEINCKAGGLKSTLEIKVNGGLWPHRHIRILNDTLIQCRAFNSYGEENASAYISVLRGSKERAGFNLLIDRPNCQPFQIPSPCSDIMEAEKPVDSVYAVSTSRLLRADIIHDYLNSAFQKWDNLVPKDSPPESARRRCLQQAKRLVCVLAFPRCFTTGTYIDDYRKFDVDPDNQLLSGREIPVCQ